VSGPRIRLFSPRDRDACLSIFDSNAPPFFAPSERPDFAAFLERANDRYVVVEDAETIVACGGWGWRERVAILCWGMVRRDRHRAGIGTLLLEHRLNAIAKGDFDSIEITTSQHSAPFFSRAGFVEVEVTPDHFAPGLHAHRMRRSAVS
jgi:N-acetylglutamate synthase-like GNAT family acetyltransferase